MNAFLLNLEFGVLEFCLVWLYYKQYLIVFNWG
jgi:hypothetical protein